MKKFVYGICLALAVAFVAPSQAQSPKIQPYFYENAVGEWGVQGHNKTEGTADACVIHKIWEDGSKFILVFDLESGEIFSMMHYTKWNLKERKKPVAGAMHVRKDKKRVAGGKAEYIYGDKNTVIMPGINPRNFFSALRQGDELELDVPKELAQTGVFIPLKDFELALIQVAECMLAHEKMKDPNILPQIRKRDI